MDKTLLLFTTVTLLATVSSCGGGDSTKPNVPTPSALIRVTGDGQSASVGAILSTALIVKVVDAGGTGIPNVPVQWSVTGGDGRVSSPTTTTDPLGLTLVTLTLGSTPGRITVSASAAQLPAVVFTATAIGPPQKLIYNRQPTNVTAGAVMVPSVLIMVQDAAGTVVPDFNGLATVAISPGTGAPGATLSGITTQVVTGGFVTFDNLRIDKAGTGYTLTATTSGLTSAVSSPFTVNVATAATLAFAVQPSDVTAGAAIAPATR